MFASFSNIIIQKALLSFADMHYLLKFIFIDSGSASKRLIYCIKDSLKRIFYHISSSFFTAVTSAGADKSKTKDLLSNINARIISRNSSEHFNQNKLLYLPLFRWFTIESSQNFFQLNLRLFWCRFYKFFVVLLVSDALVFRQIDCGKEN